MNNLHDISQEEFERIEAYLTQTLSDEDLSEFENRLKNEAGFAAKVKDIKVVLSGIETQALKEQLDDFHATLSTDNNDVVAPPKVKLLKWKKIAVAAALIIAAGSVWLLSGNPNEKLYTKYFSPDPGLPTAMGSNDNYEFYEAMVAYKEGNYKNALSKWKDQLKTKSTNDTLNYFVGSALLADKKENEAMSYLLKVARRENTVFKSEAFYYLGLAYLKANNKEKAINFLKKSDFTKAKDLLKKLN